ncbi:MAG: LLM class flavin-dependent oxidoreductase [Haloferacaceae archaeon]
MRFGIIPNWSWPTDGDPREQMEMTLEQARTAFDNRYDTVWASQHYVSEGFNHFQTVPLLARMAEFAGEKNLGTSVYLLPLHHPLVAAEQFATIDSMFDGRLDLGVSLGYKDAEFDSLDIDKSDRVGRLIEGLRIMRRLWNEDDVSYSGKMFEVDGISIDPKPDDPNVLMGGNATKSVERAGRMGDGWIVSGRTTPDEAADLLEHYERGLDQAGNANGFISLNRETFVAETTEKAERIARQGMKSRAKKWLERGASDTAEQFDDLDAYVDEMLRQRFVGSPEEVIDRIEEFEDSVGVDNVICLYNWRKLPQEEMCRSIELFSEEVIPHFQE